jgi:hypothetical protein
MLRPVVHLKIETVAATRFPWQSALAARKWKCKSLASENWSNGLK